MKVKIKIVRRADGVDEQEDKLRFFVDSSLRSKIRIVLKGVSVSFKL